MVSRKYKQGDEAILAPTIYTINTHYDSIWKKIEILKVLEDGNFDYQVRLINGQIDCLRDVDLEAV